VIVLLLFFYILKPITGKSKVNYIFVIIALSMVSIWGYTAFQTGGLINKQYQNQDAAGRVKASQFTGRKMSLK
jgi:hypothetical protein